MLILSQIFAGNSAAQQVRISSPVRFLALGDSYTIGESVPVKDRWPEQLVNRLEKRGVEVNKLQIIAQTGWRTDNLKDAINDWNLEPTFNMVSLLIGVNDQYQGVDISKYPGNFRNLLETAVSLCGGNKEGVFVLSIPDYGYTPFGQSSQQQISAEINEYNRINQEISAEIGVTYFDITPISREAISTPKYLAPDGLHPSGDMYAAWVDLMFDSAGFKIETTNSNIVNQSNKTPIFPQPATENLHFNLPDNAQEVAIYTSLGSEIYRAALKGQKEIIMNVSDWESGVFFYRIKTAQNEIIGGKFLIE